MPVSVFPLLPFSFSLRIDFIEVAFVGLVRRYQRHFERSTCVWASVIKYEVFHSCRHGLCWPLVGMDAYEGRSSSEQWQAPAPSPCHATRGPE